MSVQAYRTKTKQFMKVSWSTIKEKIGCILLVLSFLEPEGLTHMLDLDWGVVRLVGFLALIFMTLLKNRKMNFRSTILACLFYGLFYLSILFSTLINGNATFVAFTLAGQMIGFILLINYYAQNGRLKFLFRMMKDILGTMILITLLIQLIDNNIFGLTAVGNTYNFLASDNALGYWYISFMLIVYVADIGKNKRYCSVDLCFWAIICLISLISAWSATCLSVFVIFLAMLLLRKLKFMRLFTPMTSLIANIGISFLIIGLQIQKYFEWLIVDILHKDLTLSSRTYIWAAAVVSILKKPILGYGTAQGGRMDINHFTIGLNRMSAFSHNAFLEILIQGGIVAMIFFILIYITAYRQLIKVRDNTELQVMIEISIFCLLLMQFSEFVIYLPIANLPLILCFFYKDLLWERV